MNTIDFFNSNSNTNTNSNVKPKKILLLIDLYDWCFHHIALRIQKNITNHKFDIMTSAEFYNNAMEIIKNKYDIILWFYPSGKYTVRELNYIKRYNNTKLYWCLYENYTWTHHNTSPEMLNKKIHLRNNIKIWLDITDGTFYGSEKILGNLHKIGNNKMFHDQPIYYPCIDGVNTKMFNFKKYNKDILTKKKLKVGWIGNSDVTMSGLQKGFKEIKQYVTDLSANFEFCPLDRQTNYIPHEEVPNYIHNIDIIVCYSTAEGTPNQILEGSSCGRCWVSTDVGVVSPLYNTLKNNPTGIIINKDEESFKKALMTLYNNRELLAIYGKNGRRAIDVNWDWKYRLDGFENAFS
jgi:glycosyltransferase involved in cell wall biosynthesis